MCGPNPYGMNDKYFSRLQQLVCMCPQRDMATCPHQDYVRAPEDLPSDAEPKMLSGFYLRREGEPQRHVSWEGEHEANFWIQCDLYKATHQVDKGTGDAPMYVRDHGLELQCPHTRAEIKDNLVHRGLCDMCEAGHPRGGRFQNNPADHTVFLTYVKTKQEEARREEEMRIAAELKKAHDAGFETITHEEADFPAGTFEEDWVMDNASEDEFIFI
ncbi:hypothetical protein B0T19DRAFT_446496 [Cercophora scortea]|uniref:Uncharacterized protein n=1 Tax=Cercophora scortea TaxID=314031 RepID=A0AAE0I3E7_9PEZI|nr:hypothetical protein B0T19DRAFT_446496 [Cercophora scortea]